MGNRGPALSAASADRSTIGSKASATIAN